jgi:CAAX amino terminal protease family.
MTKLRELSSLICSALYEPQFRERFVEPATKYGNLTLFAVAGVFILKLLMPQSVAGWYIQLFFQVSAPNLIFVALMLIPPAVITVFRVMSMAAAFKAKYNAYTPYGDDIFSTFMMQGAMEKRLKGGAPERVLVQHLTESAATGVIEELLCRFLFTLPLAMIAVYNPAPYADGSMTILTLVVSSLIFTMMHRDSISLFDFMYRLAVGMVLYAVFIQYGLLAAVLLHIGHNAASSLSSYITKKFEARRLDAGTGIYRL